MNNPGTKRHFIVAAALAGCAPADALNAVKIDDPRIHFNNGWPRPGETPVPLALFETDNVSRDAKDRFGAFLAAGVFFYFFWQILINMGMVLGIMPVVGIPLPFISYGGSATIVNFTLVGIVVNVSMRRYLFKKG